VTTPPTPPELDPRARRVLAAGLFNHVWTLLETPDRTPDQIDEMIHAAHASRYHWGEVGEPVNLARGEWQCARVYSVLGRGEPALWHARRCLEINEAAAPETGTWRPPTRRWPGPTWPPVTGRPAPSGRPGQWLPSRPSPTPRTGASSRATSRFCHRSSLGVPLGHRRNGARRRCPRCPISSSGSCSGAR
jgi:hypothetical protein